MGVWRRISLLLATAAVSLTAAAAQGAEEGQAAFEAKCAACHRPNGQGAPGLYPALLDRLGGYVELEEGRDYLVQLVSYGMYGKVKIDGVGYNGIMPAFASWPDGKVADVLNYILDTFNADTLPADFEPFTAEEVAKRQEPKRTPREVRTQARAALLKALEGKQSAAAHVPVIKGAVDGFARNCQGCHRADGEGASGSVPRLTDFVGYYTQIEGGREYIASIPGVVYSMLDDAELANVMNWMLKTYGEGELAADFKPYTAADIARFRADPIENVRTKRAQMVRRLQVAGLIPENEDGLNDR
ncbi:cytochrome c [Ferruginivarius sediminum]|uniref:Cytochrome c domain-containing protein n=1 Tax=Ferruginivarius sediminum TaxID=2661937 RepID=A0A369T6L4_9PROT|nr:cytochrome c [Ferruginivarius sediminum]RDD60532.1 hypothetical protein DRB17_17700 [Ferruginivarius sediminum]